MSAGTDEYTQATTWNVTADMSEGINLAFYVAQNMAYTGEDAYESNQAFYGGFEGDMVSDETATGLAGTLALGAEMGELVFDVTCDVTVLQSDSVDVSFDMPNNVIDISTADEETQAAIGEEYLGLLQNGFFKLMGAPGVADVINALNPGEQ